MKSPKLNFRSVSIGFLESIFSEAGENWPEWVRDLAGKSGVYVIRSRDSGRIFYVGESHTGRLRKTLTRHFQSWSGPTSGKRYSRNAVEIAAIPTAAAKAVPLQNRLIASLEPADNTISPAGPLPAKDSNPF